MTEQDRIDADKKQAALQAQQKAIRVYRDACKHEREAAEAYGEQEQLLEKLKKERAQAEADREVATADLLKAVAAVGDAE